MDSRRFRLMQVLDTITLSPLSKDRYEYPSLDT